MLNIGLIGAGGHSSKCHAPSLRDYAARHPDEVNLTAVCDLLEPKARSAAAEFGFAHACTSVEAVLATGVNVLLAMLPIPAMLSATPALLATGLPLVIEKPLGLNIDEARTIHRMVHEARAVDRVMVSMNRRFDPAITRGFRWLRDQPPPRYVHATMIRNGRTEQDFVWGTGIHIIDALRHMFGPLELLNVTCPTTVDGQADAWRIADLCSPTGCPIHLEILPDAGEWEEHIRVLGDGYQMDIDAGMLPPWRVRAVSRLQLELDERSPADEPLHISNGTMAETTAFLDAIRTGTPLPPPSIDDALASSELSWRLHEAR